MKSFRKKVCALLLTAATVFSGLSPSVSALAAEAARTSDTVTEQEASDENSGDFLQIDAEDTAGKSDGILDIDSGLSEDSGSSTGSFNAGTYSNETDAGTSSSGFSEEETSKAGEDAVSTTDGEKAFFAANIDKNYAEYKNLTPVNVMPIEITLADKSKLKSNDLDDLYTTMDNAEAYISTLSDMVFVYDIDPDSDYYAAKINTMQADTDKTVADVDFARYNLNGEVVDGCHYDSMTGIAYIPKNRYSHYDDGTDTIMDIQAQLLIACPTDEPDTKVDVVINNDNAKGTVAGDSVLTADATDTSTVIKVAEDAKAKKNISADDISVKINGEELAYEEAKYCEDTGELVIPQSPATLTSVQVDIKTPTFWEKLFGSTDAHADSIDVTDMPSIVGTNKKDIFYMNTREKPKAGSTLKSKNDVGFWYLNKSVSEIGKDYPNLYKMYGITDWQSTSRFTKMVQMIAGNDDTKLSKVEKMQTAPVPFVIEPRGTTHWVGDGQDYSGLSANLPLKCAHISSPNKSTVTEYRESHAKVVKRGYNNKAKMIMHIFKVVQDDSPKLNGYITGYMIAGFLTPQKTTQTGAGIYKIRWKYKVKTVPPKLMIIKKSADEAKTSGQSCYADLSATFGIYTDAACTDEVEQVETESDGSSDVINDLDEGTYYIKELIPPDNYELSDEVQKVTLKNNETSVVKVTFKDTPIEEVPDPVVFRLSKVDADQDALDNMAASGAGSLEGAEYSFKFYDGETFVQGHDPADDGKAPKYSFVMRTDSAGTIIPDPDHYVSGDNLDSLYSNELGGYAFPKGVLIIQETKAPEGYIICDEKFVVDLTKDGGEVVTGGNEATEELKALEKPVKGNVKITKLDYDLKENAPQGNATLAGATIAIINRTGGMVKGNDGINYFPDETIATLTTNENGEAEYDGLPYGQYEAVETSAPNGYLLKGNTSVIFNITTNGETVELKGSGNTIEDQVIRGGVKIQKRDLELKETTPQGDGSFEKIRIDITNLSTHKVMVNGKVYQPGEVCASLYTDANGYIESANNLLPYGHYRADETEVSEGYLKQGVLSQTFDITSDGQMEDLTQTGRCFEDQVIRGGVKIQKRDMETGDTSPLGGASFENIEVTITNESKHHVLVNGKVYEPGEVCATFHTDVNGSITTSNDLLPYGSYKITETKVSEGYLLDGVLTQEIRIRENGTVVDATPEKNQIIPGVTEQHFKIRENGKIIDMSADKDSIKDWVQRGDFEIRKIDADTQKAMAGIPFKVTSLTNGESHTFTTDKNGEYRSETAWIPHSRNTNGGKDGDGIWFGTTRNGVQAPVNDKLRALPYDTYSIEELPCEANKGKVLFRDTFRIYKDQQIIYLNNIENHNLPYMTSHASGNISDVPMSQYLLAGRDSVVIDTVEYHDVSEAFLESKGLDKNAVFTLKGKLVDASTGKEILIDNKPVTAETTFTWKGKDGTAKQTFSFDATAFAGKTLVVYETLNAASKDGKTTAGVAVHADLGDTDQMIYIPAIHTTALDKLTKEHISKGQFAKDIVNTSAVARSTTGNVSQSNNTTGSNSESKNTVTICDTVTYQNLIPGFNYRMEGKLVDKATGDVIKDKAGKEVTASSEFKPESKDGKVDVTFAFEPADDLAGKTLVAFETAYHGTAAYATHADLKDEGQTIYIPRIKTTAVDSQTKDHIAYADEEVTITDTVTYENLIPGKTYTVKGTLVDKETGKPIMVTTGGAVSAAPIESAASDPSVKKDTVTSEKTFTAEKERGSVTLDFTVNAGTLAGHTVVAFEDLYMKGISVATHADLSDEEQSVHIPEIKTQALTDKKTHYVQAGEKTTFTDTVTYKNLLPGKTYTLTGILMDKETGKPLETGTKTTDVSSSKTVTAATSSAIAVTTGTSVTFTPEKSDGTEKVEFTIDTSKLAGKTIVVFEKLYLGNVPVASHEDLNDEDQSIHVIEIKTTAKDKSTGDHDGAVTENDIVIDTVSYKGLVPGQKYTVKGTLMEKDTGKPAETSSGSAITVTKEYTPEKSEGTVDVEFTLDSLKYPGTTLVVFEKLYFGEAEIASHEDINDEEQSIYYPIIKTEASVDGKKAADVSKHSVIKDKVMYKNLVPGKTYTITGILMDKNTGKAVKVTTGSAINTATGSSITITPDKPDGEAEVTFTLDSSKLKGHKLVVFEYLYDNDTLLYAHDDIDDEAQTISFNGKNTPKAPKTGDTVKLILLFGGIGALAAGIFLRRRRRRLLRHSY